MASFYQELIKEKKLFLSKDKLPPVLPIVLYSGKPPWNVGTRMQDIMTAVPKLLRAFQPQLSYFLIDEHRLTQEAFEQAPELLADTLLLNHVDNAEEFSALWQALQHKVKNHPDFELLDRIIGRWFAYSLHLKGAKIKLEDVTSIDEATAMWTFESEIERISQERVQQAVLSAQQKLQQEHEQKLRQTLEQNTLTTIKGMFAEGISSNRIAKILNISEAKVAEYLSN